MSKEVIIVGAGPSALTAAIYLSREDVPTTLYERGVVGGMAAITDQIDNYPGFAEGVTGMKLASELQQQAERFGAEIEYGDVTELKQVDGELELTVSQCELKQCCWRLVQIIASWVCQAKMNCMAAACIIVQRAMVHFTVISA